MKRTIIVTLLVAGAICAVGAAMLPAIRGAAEPKQSASKDQVQLQATNVAQDTNKQQSKSTAVVELPKVPIEDAKLIDINSIKYILLKDRALTIFSASEEAAKKYAETLNRYKKGINERVRVYSMLVPTAVEFEKNVKYRELSASQKEAFAQINSYLDKKIIQVDAYSAMEAHQKEYIYFRTDHHWTARGAYFAYAKLMETMGEKPLALTTYQQGSLGGFLGTQYKALKSEQLKNNPDTITYYVPAKQNRYTMHTSKGEKIPRKVVDPAYAELGTGAYAVFLGGDAPWGEMDGGSKNGQRIAVVKDSYGNAFIPFLIPHFEKIYIVDPRYFKDDLIAFTTKQKITDVLFINNSTVARNNGIADLLASRLGK